MQGIVVVSQDIALIIEPLYATLVYSNLFIT